MTITVRSATLVAAMILGGCGGKKADTTTPPSTGGSTNDSAGAAGSETALNGCTTFKDMTQAGSYAIPWDPSIATSDLRCVKIKAKQTVAYKGDFTAHPMKAADGTAPNPFDALADAISNPGTPEEQANFEFTTPGTYGFVCGIHATMTGAVLVVP